MKSDSKPRKRTERLKQIRESITPEYMAEVQDRLLIAKRIKEVMEIVCLNNNALASKMGVHASQVSLWLSGQHNFTLSTLSNIAFALGVSLPNIIVEAKRDQPAYVKKFESTGDSRLLNFQTNEAYKEITNFLAANQHSPSVGASLPTAFKSFQNEDGGQRQ